MNKILAALLSLSCSFLFAQQGQHLGVVAGIDNVWILNQNNYEILEDFRDTSLVQKSDLAFVVRVRYHGGFVYTNQWGKYDGIRASLLFTDIGQTYNDSLVQQPNFPSPKNQYYVSVRRNVSLYNLQIPVVYRFRTNSFGAVNWHISAGPCFSFRVKASEKIFIADTLKPASTLSMKAKDKFSKFNFGITANTGLSIRLNSQLYFEPGFSVYYSFFDINSTDLRATGWHSKNDNKYFPSYNIRLGFDVALHYNLYRYAR